MKPLAKFDEICTELAEPLGKIQTTGGFDYTAVAEFGAISVKFYHSKTAAANAWVDT